MTNYIILLLIILDIQSASGCCALYPSRIMLLSSLRGHVHILMTSYFYSVRCFFDVDNFERDKDLTIIGATWLRVQSGSAPKSYATFYAIDHRKDDQTDVCVAQYNTNVILDTIECEGIGMQNECFYHRFGCRY